MQGCRSVGLNLVVGGLAALAAANGAGAQPPTLVSPVAPGGEAIVEGRCPTFSWASGGPEDAYLVRVFNASAFSEEAANADAGAKVDGNGAESLLGLRPVIAAHLPGTASSWTPALPDCLEPGGRYVWTVAGTVAGVPEPEAGAAARFRVAEEAIPRAAARRLVATLDRLLAEGFLGADAAVAVLRAAGLGLGSSNEGEALSSAPAQSVDPDSPALGEASSRAPLTKEASLSAAVSKTCEDCEVSAVRGVSMVQHPGGFLVAQSYGVLGEASCEGAQTCGGAGVFGQGFSTGLQDLAGVLGRGRPGVLGIAEGDSQGGAFVSTSGSALHVSGYGQGRQKAAVTVINENPVEGMAAFLDNTSNFANAHFLNRSTGQVLYLQNGGNAAGTGGGNFIEARNNDETDIQFRVASNGTAYSDTSFNGGGADFAEMMDAAEGLEPGEVLSAGLGGRLTRSRGALDTAVVGVYSTAPGFIGGAGPDRDQTGRVPVAILGVVPLRASAENGPIVPGDLLVSSSSPGRAMRAPQTIPPGAVLGKALDSLSEGEGMITALLGVR